MSTRRKSVAQLAREEADMVEAEEEQLEPDGSGSEPDDGGEPAPEPEPETAAEPEPEPEPEPQAAAEPTLEAVRDLERERDRHYRAVSKIMQLDLSELTPCPGCADFVPGYAMPGTTVTVTTDDIPEPRDLPHAVRCPECNGYGKLRTPSLVAEHETMICTRCATKGYIVETPAAEPVAPIPGVPVWENVPAPAAAPAPPPDAWGRPGGHPHWGRNPADVV